MPSFPLQLSTRRVEQTSPTSVKLRLMALRVNSRELFPAVALAPRRLVVGVRRTRVHDSNGVGTFRAE